MLPPEGRVRAVLAAARKVAESAPLDDLARASGLSREGVALALSRHVETGASDDDIARLVAAVPAAPRTHVLLSSNVLIAPVRALCLAAAASPGARVRPSRREPLFARLLERALDGRLDLAIVDALDPSPGDAVHAYGRDETMQIVAQSLPRGVVFWPHGAGLGVACAASDDDAPLLADDVVAFDQRGCLSPRVVFAPDAPTALSLARALVDALSRRALLVPRGPLSPDDRADLARYRATLDAVGDALAGDSCLVGVDGSPRAITLPPACRCVHIVAASPQLAARLLAPISPLVTIIGGHGPTADVLASLCPGARRAPLGAMQRPPLDGPVDRRSAPRLLT